MSENRSAENVATRIYACGPAGCHVMEEEEASVWFAATDAMVAEMHAEGCGKTREYWWTDKQEKRIIELVRETLDLCFLCQEPLRDDWKEVVVYDQAQNPTSVRCFHSRCFLA